MTKFKLQGKFLKCWSLYVTLYHVTTKILVTFPYHKCCVMNIDQLVNLVVLPVLKYPIVFVFLLSTVTRHIYSWLYPSLLIYSIVLRLLLIANTAYKLRGPWRSLRDMNGSNVVVTGGSKGLGSEIVKELLERFPNVHVIVVDISKPKVKNPRITFYQCDLSVVEEVEQVLQRIKTEQHSIDVLINNAGMRSRYQSMMTLEPEEIRKVFQVNVFTPIRFIQELGPSEYDKQFYLVTIASALGIVAPAALSSYAATKSSAIAFHESWTFELDNMNFFNVRTLLVLPGQLNTTMFQGFAPPRQFFAPVVDSRKLAQEIVANCEVGMRGVLCAPFYSNFMHLLKSLPYAVIHLARRISKMDSCLPLE